MKRTVTKAFTILTSSAVAASSADEDEWRNFGTFIANKLRNYLPRTRNKGQHEISHIIFAADQGFFDVSHPVPTPSPTSQISSPTGPSAAGSEDVNMSVLIAFKLCKLSSVIKSTLLVVYFFHCSKPSILCPKQFALCNTHLYLFAFYQCLYNSLSHFEHNLTEYLFRNLEKILQTDVRVVCGPELQSYCQSLFIWNSCSESGIPFHNLLSD